MPTPPGPPEWRRYFYPGTEVLRNKLDIRDAAELQQIEYDVTQQQAASLEDGDLPIEGTTSAERLSFIHKALLGSIYDWAGEYRDVNITKGGHGFGDHASMGMYMRQLDGAINRFDWEAATDDQKIDYLGELHKDLNFAHPFREGNGRAARIFMSDLAAEHGIDLDFEAIDKPTWNEASRSTFLDPGGLRMDATPLVELYRQIATPLQHGSAEPVDAHRLATQGEEITVQYDADARPSEDLSTADVDEAVELFDAAVESALGGSTSPTSERESPSSSRSSSPEVDRGPDI
ncbi:Fic family protein [Corynebacterium sp.]|uniref:Fic/DOC family protein n=1 Tax=Corynebacterium sp. TaxID=1720 RepID=UPI0028B07C16|nr:Fic family protein [Corynebacterium sp.]